MFSTEVLKRLNELEMYLYDYIIYNKNKIPYMKIRELAKENYTILVVTHNMAFARDVSDEVVFVDKGEILAHGSYDELTQLENERIKQFLSFFKD